MARTTIRNDSELAAAAKKAGDLLQAVTDYAGRQRKSKGAVRFPRGFIRTAGYYRTRLQFVEDQNLRTNAAYTWMLRDVVSWTLVRTDIGGTARAMMIKLYAFITGAMVESITKDYLRGLCGKNYKKRTEYLVTAGVITAELKVDLDWIWDLRNNMHLFQLDETEYGDDYHDDTRARCSTAFASAIESLRERGRIATAHEVGPTR